MSGHLGYKEQSQDEKGRTCSKFLRNSIYQTKRDMPLVRDGTDEQRGTSDCSLAKIRIQERHKRTFCTSIQGIPKEKKEKKKKKERKVTEVNTSLWTRNITTVWQLFTKPPHPNSVMPLCNLR